ncbi:MAG TPA: hypothetical protein VJL59_15730 [Anaerolineales bacterium]|nr:hypothetical protein [Anaerolineales bacterium]
MQHSYLSRREFLRIGGLGLGAAALAACGAPATVAPTTAPSTAVPQPTATPAEEARVIVGDVLDFALKGDWPGRFGFVKFKLHAGFFNGDKAYFIRTDASDKAYAEANKLVFVPLLNAVQSVPGVASQLYLFEGGSPDQLPVLSTAPSQENYSPVWQLHQVTPKGDTLYDSEEKLKAAEASGDVTIEAQNIFVNYPVVKWASGELSVDPDKKEYLGGGQLLEPVDTASMTVKFKLHECFPGSRYIVTDTSAAPMAPMMAVAASAPVQKLWKSDAAPGTAKIWVFANGIPGSGVMGFQPAIFDSRAGDAVWSPLWNHFSLKWKDGVTPRVLKSKEDVAAALAAGDVEEFAGTPDTHPNGFIVNCPAPVLAPNTFTG